MSPLLINTAYIVAVFCFILGLKRLSSPKTARQGNALSAIGMLIAIVAVMLDFSIVSYYWIIIGLVAGSAVGLFAAKRVQMTSMPEMVALLNGFGGISSLLLGWTSFENTLFISSAASVSVSLSVVIGAVTFTGSLIAWGKLSGKIDTQPFALPGQKIISILITLATLFCVAMIFIDPLNHVMYLYALMALASVLGVISVMGIGGGDMPVVISLLNSYSGIAACMAGFVVGNVLLIVAGSLVGASGIILTNIMCKAMNRSIWNVLFGGFGATTSATGDAAHGDAKSVSAEDAYFVLEAAAKVLIVPGYGMAVAQAQHAVKELAQVLETNGAEVSFAIHPVAGRMPGHMNVLLAEADIPYEQLEEMDAVNPIMESVDVCIVLGANDVVNPDATDNESSPIYGMPIIETHRARTVFVLKRSMNPGFAGIQNPLFFKENTRMIFGDGKATVQTLTTQFKS